MKRREPAQVGLTPRLRKVFLFMGCLIGLWGFGTIYAGRLHYSNWFGGMVFAPFAALIGVASVGIAIFGKDRRNVRETERTKRFH